MKTLLLVDGSSYLYRAFHALERADLRNKNGLPTGAIYGVLNMLRRLHKDVSSDYSACVFDAKGKTFREDWYPEYKAHRPAMPDDLVRQIEPLHQCIRAMGWPLLVVEGVEADDVIGTLAKQAELEGIQTVISTGDKDIAQLVNQHVRLVNTMTNENLDVAGVIAKFCVPPERIVDYLTLVGDSVDNVPGVEKVGPKIAVKWLTQYKDLDDIVAHAPDIGGVVGNNLRKALDWLPQARKLLTIKCDVALPVAAHDLITEPQDTHALSELYSTLEFKTWLKDLRGDVKALDIIVEPNLEVSSTSPPHSYDTIITENQLGQWLEKIKHAALVCIDTETTGLDQMQAQIVGISFAIEPHHAAYLPLAHRYAGVPQQLDFSRALGMLKPWLENENCAKLGQNIKYDKHIFANHGIDLLGIVHDTLLQSYVLESHKPHDMDNLAERHLGIKTIHFEDVAGKGVNQIGFDQVSIDVATNYSAEDADIALQLHCNLSPKIEGNKDLLYVYRDIEIPVSEVLFVMERNGVRLDVGLLQAQSQELGKKMFSLENESHVLAGKSFNLNSPKQIQEILFEQQKLPVIKKTPGGVPSTGEDVLQQLALDYPLPKLLLEYRAMAKLKSTYTDKLPRMVNSRTGRVHTTYRQAVAVTGRLTSNDPNLQNIPVRTAEGRRIREAFIASPGTSIISADYSQIELRIMAHLSHDKNLTKAFKGGVDVHRHTAAEVFGVDENAVTSEQRRYAKVINFGLIYGMSVFGLASQLGIERSAAQQYMERYFSRYPGVADYMQRTREIARDQGFVETVFYRRLFLPEIKSSNGMRRQAAERAAINAPMQGTAADLIKLAMIAVHQWVVSEKLESKLIMQVHDELVLEVPAREIEIVKKKLPELMSGVAQLGVPLLVDVGVGPNWEQAH